jgi:hypothetical protein
MKKEKHFLLGTHSASGVNAGLGSVCLRAVYTFPLPSSCLFYGPLLG